MATPSVVQENKMQMAAVGLMEQLQHINNLIVVTGSFLEAAESC